MSVEILLGSHAADSILKKIKSNENRSGFKRSPVFTVATSFWQEGRNGLIEVTESLIREDFKFNPDRGFEQLPKQHREKAILNYTAIIFGITMIFNERSLIEKEINSKYLIAAYNMAMKNTFVPPLDYEEEEIEKLSSEQYRSLINLIDIKHPDSANRSLSRLYDEELDIMPKLTRKILEATKTLPIIQEVILSRYDWHVRNLIIDNARQMERQTMPNY